MKPELESAVSRLYEAVTAPEGTYSAAMAAANDVLEAQVDDANDEILRGLAPAIGAPDVRRAGIAATACGAIVERGGSAELVAHRVFDRLQELLPTVESYVEACRAHFHEHVLSEHATDCDICSPGETEAEIMSFDVRSVVREEMPEGEDAWIAFDLFCRPAVSMLLRAPALRRSADPDLAGRFERLSQFQTGAYYAFALLSVLDEHPLLVIHPGARRAFEMTINGVVENQQLQVLLADALLEEHLPGGRPDPELVAVANGSGPPRVEDIFVAPWDLFQWTALRPDGTLPDGYIETGDAHLVWNEGVPADIAELDGRRVVLLAPSPYLRSFRPTRMYENLDPWVRVERVLEDGEVTAVLEKIAAQQGQSR